MDSIETNFISTPHIDSQGAKRYYLPDGKTLHREDGPAIKYLNGDKTWWFNGNLHRVDGPAVEDSNGDKEWYLNGKRHRADGPAVEYSNSKHYFLNGVEYSFEEWQVTRKMLWML